MKREMSDEYSANELRQLDIDHVVHPLGVVAGGTPPLIVDRALGARIWDIDGREYIDGTCGLWQCLVGHGRRELAEAAAEQMQRMEFYSSFGAFSNEPAIRLAARLAALAPSGQTRAFFTSGGSEGVETAIKLVRRAWSLQDMPERTVILSRCGGYHGVGLASMTATGIPRFREGFGPVVPGFEYLSAPVAGPADDGTSDRLVTELEETIARIGAKKIAAFIGEPVLGVGGAVLPPPDYWARVQQILRGNGILLILDEIVTGFGRTGHWFGAQAFGIEPDVIVTAKGLTSGYVPMGAVMLGRHLVDMLAGMPLYHGFTYNGHATGAAVALRNLQIIEDEGLVARARSTGAQILEALRSECNVPVVTEIRGIGMMIALQLDVADASGVELGVRQSGGIVRSLGGTILLSPPLVITEDEWMRLVHLLATQVRSL